MLRYRAEHTGVKFITDTPKSELLSAFPHPNAYRPPGLGAIA
jgi:hypothetical protein